jgi:hypothetical protein
LDINILQDKTKTQDIHEFQPEGREATEPIHQECLEVKEEPTESRKTITASVSCQDISINMLQDQTKYTLHNPDPGCPRYPTGAIRNTSK